MPTAQYWGTANPGLGFFHIDVEGPAAVQWLNMDNVGIVVVNEGSITESELEQNFCEMWKVNWFWQIRQIATGRFLVRFPPSKKIKELVDYPSINLKKKGVNISFLNWEGEAEPYEPFHEVWVNVEGIPFKWLTWKVIAQVASTLGVITNVDWPVVFKTFYKRIRILVAVRDISKIPTSKLYEMEQNFFCLRFAVEKPVIEDLTKGDDDNGNGDIDGPEQEGEEEDHFNEEINGSSDKEVDGATGMGTDLTTAGNNDSNMGKSVMLGEMESLEVLGNKEDDVTPQRTYADVLTNQKSLYKEREAHVMSKLVADALARSSQTVNLVERTVDENIGRHLLQSFDEESEDEYAVLQQ
jgi:hypothetical protein